MHIHTSMTHFLPHACDASINLTSVFQHLFSGEDMGGKSLRRCGRIEVCMARLGVQHALTSVGLFGSVRTRVAVLELDGCRREY
jgi:hypothetical protein